MRTPNDIALDLNVINNNYTVLFVFLEFFERSIIFLSAFDDTSFYVLGPLHQLYSSSYCIEQVARRACAFFNNYY